MKKIVLSAIIFATCASMATAQNKYEESIKYWDEGPLTLADFSRRTVPATNGAISDLWYGWETDSERNKAGNLIYRSPIVRTFMDRLNSWVIISEFNQQQRLYLQTMFDMVEMIGRQYQKDLSTTDDFYKVRNFYRRTLSSSIDSFEQESRSGRDSSVVAYYAAKIKEQLEEKPEAPVVNQTPKFKTDIAIGMYLGYSCNALLSGLADHNGPLNFFNFGFDIPFSQKTILSWDLGITSLSNMDYSGITKDGYAWRNGQATSATTFTFDLAHRIVDKPYFAIAPFLGAGVMGISQTLPKDMWENSNQAESSNLNGLRIEGGVGCDYKILRHYFPLENSYDELYLRFKLFGAYNNLPAVIGPTWSINFGVAIGWDGWITRL